MLKNKLDDGNDYNDNNIKEHIGKHTKHAQKSLTPHNELSSSELKTIGVVTQNNIVLTHHHRHHHRHHHQVKLTMIMNRHVQ